MIANEHGIYVRMYVVEDFVKGLAIMKANDILQTKYVSGYIYIDPSSTSIGNTIHVIIENVKQNMGSSYDDAQMSKTTKIIIGSNSNSRTYGTWTSTIEPPNSRVELYCVVVENDGAIVTAKCDSETTWDESVFNRIPININGGTYAYFGRDRSTNQALFGASSFSFIGPVPSGWNEYKVSGHESNLTIGNQFTIMGLPESFVSHWVDTIHAKTYMGNGYVMLVPPESSQ